ncbi:unnamed protein product, partial [marine sediment metagenome]
MTDLSFVIPMIFDWAQAIMTINDIQAEMEYSDLEFEIVLVQNGYEDEKTPNILNAYRIPMRQGIIQYAFEEHQCGPAARMKGATMAKGKRLVFMDSHTILGRDSIPMMFQFMEETGAGIVHGATVKTHVVPPHVRGLHYRMFGNRGPNLNTHMHGSYSRAGQNDPYLCVGGNLAYTMFKTKDLLDYRGYHPKCQYYPHPEGYLPLKYQMLGREVWAVPQAFHLHSVFRNQNPHGRQTWEIPIDDDV